MEKKNKLVIFITSMATAVAVLAVGIFHIHANQGAGTYTIMFDSGIANEDIEPQHVKKGFYVDEPNVSIAGYDRAIWTTDEGYAWNFNLDTPSHNMTLTAEWTPTIYTININYGDGEPSMANPSQYTLNDNDIILNDAVLGGYTFTGYKDLDHDGEMVTKISTKTDLRNFNLEATYSQNVYGLTYTSNYDNSVLITTTNGFHFGDDVTINFDITPGYKLESVTVDGNPVEVVDNSFVYSWPSHNVEVHFTFSLIVYNITYSNVEEGGHENPTTYTVLDTIELKPATKNNYEFVKWVLDWYAHHGDGTTPFTTLVGSDWHQDMFISAVWQYVCTVVHVYSIDGVEHQETHKVLYGETLEISTYGYEYGQYPCYFATMSLADRTFSVGPGFDINYDGPTTVCVYGDMYLIECQEPYKCTAHLTSDVEMDASVWKSVTHCNHYDRAEDEDKYAGFYIDLTAFEKYDLFTPTSEGHTFSYWLDTDTNEIITKIPEKWDDKWVGTKGSKCYYNIKAIWDV